MNVGTDTPFLPPKRAPNKLRKKRPEESSIDLAAEPRRRRTVMGSLRNILGRKTMEEKYAGIETSSDWNSFMLKSMMRRSPDTPVSSGFSMTGWNVGSSPSAELSSVSAGGRWNDNGGTAISGGTTTARPPSPRFTNEDMDGPWPVLKSRQGVPRGGPPSPATELRDWALDRPVVSRSDFMPVLIRGDETDMKTWGLHIQQPLPIYPRRPSSDREIVIKPIDPVRAWRNCPERQKLKDELFLKKDPRDDCDDIPVPPSWGPEGRVLRTAPETKPDKGKRRAEDTEPRYVPLSGPAVGHKKPNSNHRLSQHVIPNDHDLTEEVKESAKRDVPILTPAERREATGADETPGLRQRSSWHGTFSSSIFMGERLAEEWEKYVPYIGSIAQAHDEVKAYGRELPISDPTKEASPSVPINPASTGQCVRSPDPSRAREGLRDIVQSVEQVGQYGMNPPPAAYIPRTSSEEWKSSLSQRWKAARDSALARRGSEAFEPPVELPAPQETLHALGEDILELEEPYKLALEDARLASPQPPAELPVEREDLRLSFAEESPRSPGSIDARLAVPTPRFDEPVPEVPSSEPTSSDISGGNFEPDLEAGRRTESQKAATTKRAGLPLPGDLAEEMEQRWQELIDLSEASSSGAIQWDTHV